MGKGSRHWAQYVGVVALWLAGLFSSTAVAQLTVTVQPDHFSFPDVAVGAVISDTLIIDGNHLTQTLPVTVWETDCGSPADIPWMAVNPVTIILPPQGIVTSTVSFDVTGYPLGTRLRGNLCIGDPATGDPFANVPADICIGGNCIATPSIPTIKELGMALMALLLLGSAAVGLRRRLG